MTDPRLERWLDAVLATPGLTAIEDRDEAWAMLVDDALRGVEVVRAFDGPIVDVGSGNGSPGLVLAASLPDREVTLLDSNLRKAAFLERAAAEFPNVTVIRARAEEHETDRFGVAVAKALAPPAVALEWVLPLVREGGAAVLWLGSVRRPRRALAGVGTARRLDRGGAERSGRRAQNRPHSSGFPETARPGPETSSRLIRMDCVPGRIYAVANQKGGVGKTTTAVNLAACLAKAGERVLLVDLDPQANATSGLGEQANGTSSCDLLDGAPPSELARPTRFENLDLIPSKPDLAGTAADLARRGDGERFLAETLAPATETHAFVFVDCPPSLGPLTVNALAAASRVLVPVQAEYYALEGLSQLVTSLGAIRTRLNPSLALAGVILTMVDARTKLSADVAAELERHFGPLLFRARVPRSVRIAEAPSHGEPMITYDPRSAGAEAYWKVAMELVDRP